MRHLVETFLNYSLGNGENTLFFLDRWLKHQPLLLRVGDFDKILLVTRLVKSATLSATAIGTSPQPLPLRCMTSGWTSFVLPSMGIEMI